MGKILKLVRFWIFLEAVIENDVILEAVSFVSQG